MTNFACAISKQGLYEVTDIFDERIKCIWLENWMYWVHIMEEQFKEICLTAWKSLIISYFNRRTSQRSATFTQTKSTIFKQNNFKVEFQMKTNTIESNILTTKQHHLRD